MTYQPHNLKVITTDDYIPPSTPEVTILPTTAEHIRAMRGKLRTEDESECIAFGWSAEKALWRSYKYGVLRKTYFVNDEIAAVSGCGGVFMGRMGQPWLLTTDVVKKISPLRFAKIYQTEVSNMLDIFPILVNYVDSRYISAVRLLKLIGFSLGEPRPLGENKNMFQEFRMVRE